MFYSITVPKYEGIVVGKGKTSSSKLFHEKSHKNKYELKILKNQLVELVWNMLRLIGWNCNFLERNFALSNIFLSGEDS